MKRAHGEADIKLISQIQAIIFLAFPVEDRERGERGWQIAKYLKSNEEKYWHNFHLFIKDEQFLHNVLQTGGMVSDFKPMIGKIHILI